MKISIITLFPEVFEPTLNSSILKAASLKRLVEFKLINLRDFGDGPHKKVDDRIYGGGAGMLLRADTLTQAVRSVIKSNPNTKVILMSASGKPYTQKIARKLSKLGHLLVICGHYEGVDQRFIDLYVSEEISIGDYVLTGGEIPAMVVIDSVSRLIPGVLKKIEATKEESFEQGLLEHPHYTRPKVFEGKKVPKVLLTGHHKNINRWRREQSIKKTQMVRPDLIEKD